MGILSEDEVFIFKTDEYNLFKTKLLVLKTVFKHYFWLLKKSKMNKLMHALNGNINDKIIFGTSYNYDVPLNYPVSDGRDFKEFLENWPGSFYYSKGRNIDEVFENFRSTDPSFLNFFYSGRLPDSLRHLRYKLNYFRNNKLFLPINIKVQKVIKKHSSLVNSFAPMENVKTELTGLKKTDPVIFTKITPKINEESTKKIEEMEGKLNQMHQRIEELEKNQFDSKTDIRKMMTSINQLRGFFSKVFNKVIPEITMEDVYELKAFSDKNGITYNSFVTDIESSIDELLKKRELLLSKHYSGIVIELKENFKNIIKSKDEDFKELQNTIKKLSEENLINRGLIVELQKKSKETANPHGGLTIEKISEVITSKTESQKLSDNINKPSDDIKINKPSDQEKFVLREFSEIPVVTEEDRISNLIRSAEYARMGKKIVKLGFNTSAALSLFKVSDWKMIRVRHTMLVSGATLDESDHKNKIAFLLKVLGRSKQDYNNEVDILDSNKKVLGTMIFSDTAPKPFIEK